MLGHIALAIPGNITMFFVSMILIVIGTGLLKPNVSSVVGDIYPENDNRRDSGFSIFYMGINLGAFISPLIVGSLMKTSFHLGFGVAAVGMFLGLLVFIVTKKKNLGTSRNANCKSTCTVEKKKVFSTFAIATVVIAILIAIAIPRGWLTFDSFIAFVGILGFLIPTAYFIVMYRSPKTNDVERSRIIAFIPSSWHLFCFGQLPSKVQQFLQFMQIHERNLILWDIKFPRLVPIV